MSQPPPKFHPAKAPCVSDDKGESRTSTAVVHCLTDDWRRFLGVCSLLERKTGRICVDPRSIVGTDAFCTSRLPRLPCGCWRPSWSVSYTAAARYCAEVFCGGRVVCLTLSTRQEARLLDLCMVVLDATQYVGELGKFVISGPLTTRNARWLPGICSALYHAADVSIPACPGLGGLFSRRWREENARPI